tara:strand:- start:1048 stop:1737 length:690 start_codon:yes stop_codon:yes gene_type:complete
VKSYFIDLDGVLIDSIDECWLTASKAYFGIVNEDARIKSFFYEHRGLVGPPFEFASLFKLAECLLGDPDSYNQKAIESKFKKINENSSYKEKEDFEAKFFLIRSDYKKNIDYWLGLHQLTDYGNFLRGKKLQDYFIITTKDRASTEDLMSHFELKFNHIYANSDVKEMGSKSLIIETFLERNNNYNRAIFVDDSVEHLKLCNSNIIDCYFADWGYGNNESFEIFDRSLW